MRLADARILFAPAHYYTGADIGGSEFGWPYEIVHQAARYAFAADVVVGELRNGAFPPNVTVHEVLPVARQHLFSTGTALRFTFAYWKAGLGAARRTSFHLLHHILPYSSMTFNPLIVLKSTPLGVNRATRVVVGPLQMPHDEQPSTEVEDTGALYRREFSGAPGAGAASGGESSGGESSAGSSGSHARKPRPQFGSAIARRLSRNCLNRADVVVAITDETKDYLIESGIRSRIEVIPTGVRSDQFTVVNRSDRSGPFALFLPTYFLARKGIDLLLRAVARARTRCDVQLVLLGDGPQRARIVRAIDELALRDAVQMPGFVNHAAIRERFAAADAYVSMSWSESLPVAMMEAMATSLPCISTANAGARALIENERTGILTPLGDVDAFAAAIERLASDRRRAQAIGAAARAAIETRYDWDRIGTQYAALYQSVLDGAAR